MKKILLSTFIILISAHSIAQRYDLSYHQNVNKFANDLIINNIDTIFVYEKYDESKETKYTQYVFWKESKQSFATKFDQNKIYTKVELKCDNFWKMLSDNIATIKNETVEPFGYIAKNQGKDIAFTTSNPAVKVVQFKVYANGDITHGWYNSFDFLKEDIIKNELRENIYFERNSNLKGKLLTDKLEELIIEIEKR